MYPTNVDDLILYEQGPKGSPGDVSIEHLDDAVSALEAAIALKLDASSVDTDPSLAANSDSRVASQKAVRAYVAAYIAAQDVMVFKGVINCSTNPNYPAADTGHQYRVSIAGKIGGPDGAPVEGGDILLCLADGTSSDSQAAVGSRWSIIQTNIDGAVTINGTQTLTGKTLNGANNEITVRLTDDVSGNLPVSRLNDGANASGTTFWCGDGSWKDPQAAAAGQLPATATNDNASAGKLGEYIFSSLAGGGAVTLANVTVANVCYIDLTAGDWDLGGTATFLGGGSPSTVKQLSACLSEVSGAFGTIPGGLVQSYIGNIDGLNIGSSAISYPTSTPRITVANGVTVRVYLVVRGSFTDNAPKAYGAMWARRAR